MLGIMVSREIKLAPNPWETVLLWIVTDTLSILGGILLGAFLNDTLWNTNLPQCVGDCISIDMLINNPIQRAFVFGLSIGGIKSLCEMLVLQKWKIRWDGWFPASIVGWSLGVTIAVGLEMFNSHSGINQLLGGMVIGISQWVILRHYLPKAYWWIIANVIGCFAVLSYIPLGYTFSMMLENSVVFFVMGFFAGLMTSVVLSWLLNLSRLEKR
jgi:hypothetical protein